MFWHYCRFFFFSHSQRHLPIGMNRKVAFTSSETFSIVHLFLKHTWNIKKTPLAHDVASTH